MDQIIIEDKKGGNQIYYNPLLNVLSVKVMLTEVEKATPYDVVEARLISEVKTMLAKMFEQGAA